MIDKDHGILPVASSEGPPPSAPLLVCAVFSAA